MVEQHGLRMLAHTGLRADQMLQQHSRNPLPASGEDFHGQDAQYVTNPRSYTKLDASGNDLPDSAASWTMVRDNVTGLIWEVKQAKDGVKDYSNPHDADNIWRSLNQNLPYVNLDFQRIKETRFLSSLKMRSGFFLSQP